MRRAPEQHFPGEDDVDPEESARVRRHPSALGDAEPEELNRPRPVEDAGHPGPPTPSSGTLSSLGDSDGLPVVESGLPLEPEDLGRQFLRDATEQDNFESEVWRSDIDRGLPQLGQMVSEATRESAGQEDLVVPESSALVGSRTETHLEPPSSELDMMSDAIVESSLFDQHVEDVEEGDVREPSYVRTDDLEAGQTPGARPSGDEEAREGEMKRTRKTLTHGRGGQPVRLRPSPRAERSKPALGTGQGEAREGTPAEPRIGVRSSRQARHAAHVIQTSRRAVELVADVTELDDFEQAMTALEVVVGGIVRRITPSEAGDFLAQLPSELRSRVIDATPAGPEPSLTRATIESELSSRLQIGLGEASQLVDQIGIVLEQLISAGEIAHVRAQLPKELQSIFRGDVAHRTP
jgi:uncharacterized protein (DUF2267 family)